MEKLDSTETLRMIARGEIDLDRISEVIRSADLVIRSYQMENETLRQNGDQLQFHLDQEKRAVDDLVCRLTRLHEENLLARQVFQTEIEGKRSVLGIASTLDLEALDMAGLIRERENTKKALGKTLGMKPMGAR